MRLEPIDVLKCTINNVSSKFFNPDWDSAAHRQKGYMRKHLHMGNKNPEEFYEPLKRLNEYLTYFPK